MKNSIKSAIAAALVMGITSYAHAGPDGSNHGTVTYIGTIEESACSIKAEDVDKEVDLGGSIGTGTIAAGKDSTKIHYTIELEGCNFTAGTKNMHTVITAASDAYSGNSDYLALMSTQGTGEMKGAYIQLGNKDETPVKLGEVVDEGIVMESDNVTGKTNQTVHLTAWVHGVSTTTYSAGSSNGTIDLGPFRTPANYEISYD
ncbi:TPA: fimbrial protein [Escherichia coli]|nr:fimbrial protein [Escherichia coli]EHD2967663.1 fimbrial protein [Escherichia coli]EHE9876617.1 fimbrial protein [Escherichia coli]EKM4468921.1 fimbrial protein [Escherichia coli]NJB23994.1 fimbrial protein [Escherichia coli]